MKTYVLTAVLALFIGGAAQAATLTTFDESTSGDAGDRISFAKQLGTLGAGDTFKVSGGTTDEANGDHSDYYAFSSLVDFAISVNSFQVSEGVTMWLLYVDDGNFFGPDDEIGRAILSTGDTGDLFGSVAAGDYFAKIYEPTPNTTSAYSFNIIGSIPSATTAISPVPVPAGAPLLLGGLGAMIWIRSRKMV